jgi:16S rRNA (cytidine1402-2'-O)-methyltransferase
VSRSPASTATRSQAGRLVLVGTPIGNLEDVSVRMRGALERADVLFCEDTRRTRALLSAIGVRGKRLVSLHRFNEASRVGAVLAELARGATAAVVSDAGMPVLADPGARVVRAAIEAGVTVEVIPGPNAALVALAGSGLDAERFAFEGFLPRDRGRRRRRLEAVGTEQRTVVLYESPRRLAATLRQLAEVVGEERRVAVARELTKAFEEFFRGSLAEAVWWAEHTEVRGEVTIVLEGADEAARRLRREHRGASRPLEGSAR